MHVPFNLNSPECTAYGRNGYVSTTGITLSDVSNVHGVVVDIEPWNGKGDITGGTRITIPVSAIPSVVKALKEIYAQYPEYRHDDPSPFVGDCSEDFKKEWPGVCSLLENQEIRESLGIDSASITRREKRWVVRVRQGIHIKTLTKGDLKDWEETVSLSMADAVERLGVERDPILKQVLHQKVQGVSYGYD